MGKLQWGDKIKNFSLSRLFKGKMALSFFCYLGVFPQNIYFVKANSFVKRFFTNLDLRKHPQQVFWICSNVECKRFNKKLKWPTLVFLQGDDVWTLEPYAKYEENKEN